jgi:hypothetical protein
MSAFKHSAVSFGTSDTPPPEAGRNIGPISLHNAIIPGLPWAAAFGHRIFRPADDENYVVLDLEFESEGEAEAYLEWLRREVWSSREASPALAGGPQTRIAKVMGTQQY